MKRTIFMMIAMILLISCAGAQEKPPELLKTAVAQLDGANTVNDYDQLAGEFMNIAQSTKTEWLPYYYAALCNAKIGWLKQDTDPDNIETYANKAEDQIKQARALLDTATQQKELSEVFCVLSMINRARVFINPMTYGRKYGPLAGQYTKLAGKTDPGNPRALYLEGWEKFSTPKMWGGDKNKAKELLLSAKEKLERETPDGSEPHWGKKETDALLKQLK